MVSCKRMRAESKQEEPHEKKQVVASLCQLVQNDNDFNPTDTPLIVGNKYVRQIFPVYEYTWRDELDIVLNVPFVEKENAKSLGCKWRQSVKKWLCASRNYEARARWGINKCWPYPKTFKGFRVNTNGWIATPKNGNLKHHRSISVRRRFYSHIVDLSDGTL